MNIAQILEDQVKRDLGKVDLAEKWVEEIIEERTECFHKNTFLAQNGPDDYKTVCRDCLEES